MTFSTVFDLWQNPGKLTVVGERLIPSPSSNSKKTEIPSQKDFILLGPNSIPLSYLKRKVSVSNVELPKVRRKFLFGFKDSQQTSQGSPWTISPGIDPSSLIYTKEEQDVSETCGGSRVPLALLHREPGSVAFVRLVSEIGCRSDIGVTGRPSPSDIHWCSWKPQT